MAPKSDRLLDKNNFHPSATAAGFKLITYPQLFEKILLNMGDYIIRANNKYLVFLLEFIKSIEDIHRGSQMDNELIKFFEKYQDEAEAFFLAFNSCRAALREMVTNLKNLMNIKDQEGKVLQFLYRESGQLWDALVHDLFINETFTVVVECEIAPYGWGIDIADRKERIHLVEELLQKKGIGFDSVKNGKIRFKSFGFDEPIGNVHMEYESVIKRILGQD